MEGYFLCKRHQRYNFITERQGGGDGAKVLERDYVMHNKIYESGGVVFACCLTKEIRFTRNRSVFGKMVGMRRIDVTLLAPKRLMGYFRATQLIGHGSAINFR